MFKIGDEVCVMDKASWYYLQSATVKEVVGQVCLVERITGASGRVSFAVMARDLVPAVLIHGGNRVSA